MVHLYALEKEEKYVYITFPFKCFQKKTTKNPIWRYYFLLKSQFI